MKKIGLSVVIPVYNSETWIGPTLRHVLTALKGAHFDSEIIVVDDGSNDGSVAEAESVRGGQAVPIRVIAQKNTGRYLARKKGVEVATKDNILFIDSRVFIDKGSLSYLEKELQNDHDQIWNGHVNVEKKGNIFARFWDAVACIGWRRYFKRPLRTSYGLQDFDYYPKGTGFFFVPKKRLLAAMKFFEKSSNDLQFSSDDTLLIRYMAERKDINLSPEFSCLYHGRSTLKGFLKHAYNRGQFFVDGFLRPGTRFFYPLLGVLGISIVVVVALIASPLCTLSILGVGLVLFAVGLFVISRLLGVQPKDAGSLAVLGVPFAAVYLGGLWRGVARKIFK